MNTLDVAAARERWVAINRKMMVVETLLLRLLRHADTTHEQLIAAHKGYKDMHEAIAKMQAELEKAYPVKALLLRDRHASQRSLWARELL